MKRANATPMEGIPHYPLLMGLLILVAGAGAGFSFIKMEDDTPEEFEDLKEDFETQEERRKDTDTIVSELEKTREAIGDSSK
jgi:hypothetical protein